MKSGLLWYDDDPGRSLEDKVLRAAQHYTGKYGRAPTLCCIHPSALEGNENNRLKKVGSVEIRAGRSVLPHHFWLDVADESKPKAQAQRGLPARTQTEAAPMLPEKTRQLAVELGR